MSLIQLSPVAVTFLYFPSCIVSTSFSFHVSLYSSSARCGALTGLYQTINLTNLNREPSWTANRLKMLTRKFTLILVIHACRLLLTQHRTLSHPSAMLWLWTTWKTFLKISFWKFIKSTIITLFPCFPKNLFEFH